MSDINVNLNVPITWDEVENRATKYAIRKITKECVSKIKSLNMREVENYLKFDEKDNDNQVANAALIRLLEIAVHEYCDAHMGELIDRAVENAVGRLMKKKTFVDLVNQKASEYIAQVMMPTILVNTSEKPFPELKANGLYMEEKNDERNHN